MNDFFASSSTSFTRESWWEEHTDRMTPIRDPNVDVLTAPVEDSSSDALAVAAAMEAARLEHAASAAAIRGA
jgi:hypothetical protein